MRVLPPSLVNAPNGHPMIMDRHNLAHRVRDAEQGRAGCGLQGTMVTLAQAIVWSVGYCTHVACYPPGRREVGA